ncbi:hypothetical protein [Halosolutus halophilus]|uniref:hypothetical protein n=1 Tax=Halosolutus halophilus TaxID=1552990 RepID=UPI002234FBBA|nr:hypothetical protein [Halosolutus halophilus]
MHQSNEGYSRLYDQYPSHSISIGPYKPDVLGYTPSNRVFAIEVKGTENLRKGLGQAISYQRGVDHAYLAADQTKLNRVHDLALSKGIGVFEVDRDARDVAEKHPYAAEMKDLLYNTRHQLESMYVTANQQSRRLPNYADPLNQLMPVVAIAGHDRTTDAEIEDLVEAADYPYRSAYKRMIRLAEYLGMIHEANDEYCLTQQGTMGWTMLQGYGTESVADLKTLKERGPLYQNHPPIATYLRNRFVSNPDFRTLFEVLLRRSGDRLSIQELCATLIDNYPSTFLNLVYTDPDGGDAPYLIEQGRGDEIYEDPDYLGRIVHSQFISNTASQFKSLGVLGEGSPVIEPKSALDPRNDYWYPRGFQLG